MTGPGEGSVDFGQMFDEAVSPSPAPETAPEPTPPVEEPVTPPAEPVAESPSRARDEHGRFTQQPPTSAPAPTEPSAPTAEVPAPPATPQAPDISAYPPFEYPVAGNRRLRIDGAVMDEQGSAFFPKEAVPKLHQLLHDAHETQTIRSNMGRMVKEAQREGSEMLQRGQHLMQHMDQVFSAGQVGTPEWENQVLAFALNWAREKPRLEAEARALIAEENRKALEAQIQERQTEESRAEQLPRKYAAVDDWTQRLASQYGFSPQDITALQQRYRSPEWFDRLFEDQNGETFIVHELIDKDLQYLKRFYRPAPAPSRPVAPPPPVAAGRSSAPSRPTKPAAPASDAKLSIKERDKKIFESVFE